MAFHISPAFIAAFALWSASGARAQGPPQGPMPPCTASHPISCHSGITRASLAAPYPTKEISSFVNVIANSFSITSHQAAPPPTSTTLPTPPSTPPLTSRLTPRDTHPTPPSTPPPTWRPTPRSTPPTLRNTRPTPRYTHPTPPSPTHRTPLTPPPSQPPALTLSVALFRRPAPGPAPAQQQLANLQPAASPLPPLRRDLQQASRARRLCSR